MLLCSTRDNCDMPFHQCLRRLHSCREGGTAGGMRNRGRIVCVMPLLDASKKLSRRSHVVIGDCRRS